MVPKSRQRHVPVLELETVNEIRNNSSQTTKDYYFYRAATMQARSSYEHLSGCLSVKSVYCDTTKVMPIFLYHMKGEFIFFGHKEWLVGDARLYLKFWVKLTHPASKRIEKRRFSIDIRS